MEYRSEHEEQQPRDDKPADHVVPHRPGTRRQWTVSMGLPGPIHAGPEVLRRWDLPLGEAPNLAPCSCHGTSLTFQLLDVHACGVCGSGDDLAVSAKSSIWIPTHGDSGNTTKCHASLAS